MPEAAFSFLGGNCAVFPVFMLCFLCVYMPICKLKQRYVSLATVSGGKALFCKYGIEINLGKEHKIKAHERRGAMEL